MQFSTSSPTSITVSEQFDKDKQHSQPAEVNVVASHVLRLSADQNSLVASAYAKGTSSILAKVRVMSVFPVPVGPLIFVISYPGPQTIDKHHENIALLDLNALHWSSGL